MKSKIEGYYAVVPESYRMAQAIFESRREAGDWAETNAVRPYKIVLLDAELVGNLTEIPAEVKVVFDSDNCSACRALNEK
jgi:hypothetical protein